MRILYIVNNKSKTSIPLRWCSYANMQKMNLHIYIKKYSEFVDLIREFYYSDIIHGHHIKSMFIAILLNVFFRKPTVYTVHGSTKYLSKVNLLMFNIILHYTDKLVFVNNILHEELNLKQKCIIIDKYEIILNGVELDFNYVKKDVFKKYGVPPMKKYVFHPARFVEEKNHIRILQAFKNLIVKNPGFGLILAGDGILRREIENTLNELGINKDVFLLGTIERDEVYNFLGGSELFIMPSVSEGLNIAYLEAISMGCKILVSNIKQFTHPLRHYNIKPSEINVFYCDPYDINDIERVFTESLSSRKKTGYSAEKFSLFSMLNKYKVMYSKVLLKKENI